MRGKDILGISETWLKPITSNSMVDEQDYVVIRQDRSVTLDKRWRIVILCEVNTRLD